MLVEFTKHSDTSAGRMKIGQVFDIDDSEALKLISENRCKSLEPLIEEEEDGSRDE